MARIKIINRFLIIIFLAMLLFPPIWWATRQGNWSTESVVEARSLDVFPRFDRTKMDQAWQNICKGNFNEANDLLFTQFLNGKFQKAVNDAAMDQFPFRLAFGMAAKGLERIQIGAAYAFLGDPAIPASLDTDYLVMRDEPVFIQYPILKGEVSRRVIDERIQNYQELINTHPDIHFSVFYLERMAFAPYNPARDFFPEADNGSSYRYFFENIPAKLKVASLRLGSYQEHKEKFFRTDHHWNARGAWQGYSMIYDLLAQTYPEISPKLELKKFQTIHGAEFCGSYARRTLVPCIPDPFEVAVVDLPQFVTLVDGKEQHYGHREQYLKGEFNREKYISHYAEYYGNIIDLVEYRFENGSQRDLLLLGNSYSQAAQLFIAAHYRNTFVVDFREDSDFDLSQFLAEHPVDDILLLGDVIVYGRENWLVKP